MKRMWVAVVLNDWEAEEIGEKFEGAGMEFEMESERKKVDISLMIELGEVEWKIVVMFKKGKT